MEQQEDENHDIEYCTMDENATNEYDKYGNNHENNSNYEYCINYHIVEHGNCL